jgi:hypothetical protein
MILLASNTYKFPDRVGFSGPCLPSQICDKRKSGRLILKLALVTIARPHVNKPGMLECTCDPMCTEDIGRRI